MGNKESAILAFAGLITGIILSGWVVMQIPHTDPTGLAIIGFVLMLSLGSVGWRLGINQNFIR